MMPCISKKIVAPAIAVLVLAVPASSHDHATGVVKDRMDMMEEMAKRMKVIRARIDSKTGLAAIKEDAGSIASHAPHPSSPVSARKHAKANRRQKCDLAQ